MSRVVAILKPPMPVDVAGRVLEALDTVWPGCTVANSADGNYQISTDDTTATWRSHGTTRSELVKAVRGAPTVEVLDRQHEVKINGRKVGRDTELTILDVRGRCRFLSLTTNPKNGATWVDVVDARGNLRSFAVDQVTRVHRVPKTRENHA